MKASTMFALVLLVGGAVLAVSGCGSVGPAPITGGVPVPPNPTPPANLLYVDHLGTLYSYRLPLSSGSKPFRALPEWPGLGIPPAIAVGPHGEVAVASPTEIRIFRPPIVSFTPSHAKVSIKLNPAITEMGPYGADLVDMEYDPNDNLWLFNDIGAEISELHAPVSKNNIAALTLAFGQPGSKTAGFTFLNQGRFDVNATLYVYASSPARSLLFKVPFPYAKPPSSVGINVAQAAFVNVSQYLPTALNPADLLLGQYVGQLRTPTPGSPPSPPVDVMSQFNEPLNPVTGLIPNAHADTIINALIADPPRERFYATEAATGTLDVYNLPLAGGAKPVFSLLCPGGASLCDEKGAHVFLAP